MSKKGYISRYLLILKKLRQKPYSSFEELTRYLDTQFSYLQMQDETLNVGISKRTLQRDLREIRNIFGIDIEYSKREKGYFLNENEAERMNFERMMEAFDMFNSLNMAQDLTGFVHAEKRRPQGTENLYGVLHAIKNKLQVRFSYHKYWEDEITARFADPYALKEFKHRWYLLAKDNGDGRIKSFALDRLSQLDISSDYFSYPNNYNVEESFRFCFGIIHADEDEPQDIVLSFDPFQGKYMKSLPLHHTQQVIADNDKELKIKLRLFITDDFLMEILSFGNTVKVIQPQALIDQIKLTHEKAFYQYK